MLDMGIQSQLNEVVLYYFKSKLHSIYNREREATLQASLWGPGESRFDDVDYLDDGETFNVSSQRSTIIRKIEAIVGAFYLWLHAGTEAFVSVGCCWFLFSMIACAWSSCLSCNRT